MLKVINKIKKVNYKKKKHNGYMPGSNQRRTCNLDFKVDCSSDRANQSVKEMIIIFKLSFNW